MSVDLNDLTDRFKNSLAVPGGFSDAFPGTTDDDLLLSLLNGMADAMLDGFFPNVSFDDTGIVSRDYTQAEGALIILYARTMVLENEIRNRKTRKAYKAGAVSFEEDQAASVLVEILKEAAAKKEELRDQAKYGSAASSILVADQYLSRTAGLGGPTVFDPGAITAFDNVNWITYDNLPWANS